MAKANTGVGRTNFGRPMPARIDESGYAAGGQTEVWSVHKRRSMARAKERQITRVLALWERRPPLDAGLYAGVTIDGRALPPWVKGARVRRAGLLQHVVELTSWVGH